MVRRGRGVIHNPIADSGRKGKGICGSWFGMVFGDLRGHSRSLTVLDQDDQVGPESSIRTVHRRGMQRRSQRRDEGSMRRSSPRGQPTPGWPGSAISVCGCASGTSHGGRCPQDGHCFCGDLHLMTQRLRLLAFGFVSQVGPRCSYGSRGFALSQGNSTTWARCSISSKNSVRLKSIFCR